MTAIAGSEAQILITSSTNTTMTDEVLLDSGDHTKFTVTVANAGHRYWDDNATFVIQKEVDDIQTVTITGAPTGGTFTLTFGGDTTSGIAYNAAAADVQAALVALASIGAGNVGVTGNAGGPYTVEFKGTLGYASQSVMTASGAGLTGGTSPGVTVTHTQTGSTWTTAAATTYTIQYVGGKVIFGSALLGTPSVRVHSGAYLAYSAMADATKAEPSYEADMLDSTSFTTDSTAVHWRTYIPSLTKASFKISKWSVDGAFLDATTSATKYVLSLIPSVLAPTPNRMEAYAYTKTDGIKADVSALVSEDLEFQVSGQFYIV